MTINLPPELEDRISPHEAALHLAIGLFADDKINLGQAASIAGLSKSGFLQELGNRRISVHYDIQELEQDIAAVQKTSGKS
jgi:predicted HTH domain antitoxin